MKVGDNIKVKFYHDTRANHVDIKGAKQALTAKEFKEFKNSIEKCSTGVEIWRDDELVSSAKVWCSLEDNYSRKSGRELATSKAILHPSISDLEADQIIEALHQLPSYKRSITKVD